MQDLILFNTPATELKELFRDVIKEELSNLKQQQKEENLTATYLSRQQVCKLLNLSLVTVDKFTRQGILKGYRIGGRIRYKQHEVEESLTAVKDAKYRRARR